MIFDFKKSGQTVYKTVGWPGFVVALSDTKPSAFSVTLNAVLSHDESEIATPISFLLRETLEQCDTCEAAKIKLEQTTIASDCLLLLSGKSKEEMTVIERTPKRHESRATLGNLINSYQ